LKIKPYDTNIESLLSSAFYKIPRFQRPYSWDRDNVDDFWGDIVGSTQATHFIGSMVFYSTKDGQHLYVVDGQQRLTTITVFLAALRDALADAGEIAPSNGTHGFIERRDKNDENRYVLVAESSSPYLQEYIQKQGAPEVDIKPSGEELGLKSAYDFARGQLKSLAEQAKNGIASVSGQKTAVKKQLVEIRDRVLALSVIIIELDNEADAYIVFETLNTRGKDLEPKDLIKNLLTKLLPAKSANVDPAKLKWDKITKLLGQSTSGIELSTYIHHYWLSRFDYTSEKNLFDRVKSYLKKTNAADFLDRLVENVDLYRRLHEPSGFSWKKEEESLKESILALGIFRVRQPTPMLLSVLRAFYIEKKISLKQARDVLGAIEAFHYRYTAVAGQSSSGGVSKMYSSAAIELSTLATPQELAAHLQDFRAKLRTRWPDEAAFNAGLADLRYSQAESRDRQLIRYSLTRLDRKLRADAVVDYGKMTIEHLAPQSPGAGEALVATFNTIGNLILVGEKLNGDLKNKKFSEKKKILEKAHVPLDDGIKKANSWGVVEIEGRAKAIGDLLYAAD
jgi:hypothetical protein